MKLLKVLLAIPGIIISVIFGEIAAELMYVPLPTSPAGWGIPIIICALIIVNMSDALWKVSIWFGDLLAIFKPKKKPTKTTRTFDPIQQRDVPKSESDESGITINDIPF